MPPTEGWLTELANEDGGIADIRKVMKKQSDYIDRLPCMRVEGILLYRL